MQIAIDARPAEKEGFGIARYSFELIKALTQIDSQNTYILLSNSDRLLDLIKGKNNFSLYKIESKWLSIFEQFELPLILNRLKPDIFHATSFAVPLFTPCKTIISILDLIHLRYPYSLLHQIYYYVIVKNAALRAHKIITISESSKADIIKYLHLPEEKIKVIYICASDSFHPVKEKDVEKLPRPFILTVGNPKPHKNTSSLVRAFKVLKEKYNLCHKLVIVGEINNETRSLIDSSGLGAEIMVKTNVKDTEMNFLYNSADVFVFPSLLEGFGLPVLEAMASGTPVVASNVSSIPEVAGEAGILVDPKDADGMAAAIHKILTEKDFAQSLREKGRKRAEMFSWLKCARETLDVYKEAGR